MTVGQDRSLASELQNRPVALIRFRESSLFDVLLQLGQERRVAIGTEYVDAAAFRSRILCTPKNSSVGGLLDTITHRQGYRWRV